MEIEEEEELHGLSGGEGVWYISLQRRKGNCIVKYVLSCFLVCLNFFMSVALAVLLLSGMDWFCLVSFVRRKNQSSERSMQT